MLIDVRASFRVDWCVFPLLSVERSSSHCCCCCVVIVVALGARCLENNGSWARKDTRVIFTSRPDSDICVLPLGAQADCAGCVRCACVVRWAAQEGKDPLMQHLRQHDGPRMSNSQRGPAQAEEQALAICGEDLLPDKNGSHRGNKQAIFLGTTVSDGDSKGAHRLVRKQAETIGPAVLGRAEQSPCSGHSSKCLSNAVRNIKKADASFGGVGGLENDRIKATLCDINPHVRLLGGKTNAQPKRSSAEADKRASNALKGIKAVMPCHCGIHSGCVGADQCGCLALKLKSALWKDKDGLSALEEQELFSQSTAPRQDFDTK